MYYRAKHWSLRKEPFVFTFFKTWCCWAGCHHCWVCRQVSLCCVWQDTCIYCQIFLWCKDVFIVRIFFVMQVSFDSKHYDENSLKLITRFYSICIQYQYHHLKFPTRWILWQSVWACISSHRHSSCMSK